MSPRDGRDGLRGPPGLDGARGPTGRDGLPGKDADPLLVVERIDRQVAQAVAEFPRPKDGEKGDRGERGQRGLPGINGAAGATGLQGKDGAQGPQGQRGPAGPVGPIPNHRWQDTALQFELQSGAWGDLVELRGPAGKPGKSVEGGGGGTVIMTGGNSWMPSGW